MRNENGRFILAWESTRAFQEEAWDYRDEAETYGRHFVGKTAVVNVVVLDNETGDCLVLKGKVPGSYHRAIPTRKQIVVTRAQLLILERLLSATAERPVGADGEATTALLEQARRARAELEQEQERQRKINAAAGSTGA